MSKVIGDIADLSPDRVMGPERQETFRVALYGLSATTFMAAIVLVVFAAYSMVQENWWSMAGYVFGLVIVLPSIHVILCGFIKDNYIGYDKNSTGVPETASESTPCTISNKLYEFLKKEHGTGNLNKPEYDRIIAHLEGG